MTCFFVLLFRLVFLSDPFLSHKTSAADSSTDVNTIPPSIMFCVSQCVRMCEWLRVRVCGLPWTTVMVQHYTSTDGPTHVSLILNHLASANNRRGPCMSHTAQS